MATTITKATVTIPTDLRGILKSSKDREHRRHSIHNAALQSDGEQAQIIATCGATLAVVDVDDGEVQAGAVLLPLASMPTRRKDRTIRVHADANSQPGEAAVTDADGIGGFPPIGNIIPAEATAAAAITVNVERLRRLLDAVAPLGDKEVTVTIRLQDSGSRPATLVTPSGVGVIMPVTTDNHPLDLRKGLAESIDAASRR